MINLSGSFEMLRSLSNFLACGIIAAAGLFSIAATSADANANLLVNGSFEDVAGTASGAPFDTLGTGSGAITGWTVDSGSVDWIGSYWPSSDGVRNVDMSGNEPGSISQIVGGLIAGTKYILSFDMAQNPDGPPATSIVGWSLGTSASGSESESSSPYVAWVQHVVLAFVYDGGDTTLTFTSLDSEPGPFPAGAFGPAIDNASLIATPIPPAAVLFVTALGGLGFLARRRTRASTRAV